MKYNFDELITRRGTHSYKWDSSEASDILPLWVADMDFRTAPTVTEALQRRVAQGIFGYTKVPEAYYKAIVNWFARRHKWQVSRDWIIYTTGVVPALSAIIKALTTPGDRVLVQTPVYNCFFSSIRNNGCEVATSPLIYEDGAYRIDFADLERQASDPKVRLFLLCNPHNPTGRVWTRQELTRIGEICFRHNVQVVADEIHGELVYPGHTFIPFASLSDEFQRRTITCTSPSKAFNLAGLQIANIISADAEKRAKIDRAININEVCDVNPFGVEALIAAYSEGEEWLDELRHYLYANYNCLKAYFSQYLPQFKILPLEGTYLVWVDCSILQRSSEEIEQLLLEKGKIWINAGTMYGEAGEGFIRINIACPRKRLIEGLKGLRDVLITPIQNIKK